MNYSPFFDADEYIEALEAYIKDTDSLLKEAVSSESDPKWLERVTEILDLPPVGEEEED